MTPRLCGAEYLGEYRIFLTFEDGKAGVIDLRDELRGEVFEPLRDVGLFRRFRFDAELDTIVWPTGADLAPEYLYENAVAGELRPVVESAVDQPFFPVSKVRVRATDTGHTFRRHWAVVADDRREVFAIVTEDYRLVSNLRAYELGRRAFALVFGDQATKRLQLFNVNMPMTRSWVNLDLTAGGLDLAPLDEDRWLPFLRVTNSYNRSRALGFTVGVCRWICTNGIDLRRAVAQAERRAREGRGSRPPPCRSLRTSTVRRSRVQGQAGEADEAVRAERTIPGGDARDPRDEAPSGTPEKRRARGWLVAPRALVAPSRRQVRRRSWRHGVRARQRRNRVRERRERPADESGPCRCASGALRAMGGPDARTVRVRVDVPACGRGVRGEPGRRPAIGGHRE